jgi:hypothetical protein
MPNHFLLRIGDGSHFKSSSTKSIWGITSKHPFAKRFISIVKEGDLLWFVTGGSNGLIVALATFTGIKERVLGPLLALTLTNEELGWNKSEGEWDKEVHYKNLYNLSSCGLFSEIKAACGIRLYNDKCKIDLPKEYINIIRYSKITSTM